LGLDRLGVLQVLGGIALGLIALFSSCVHITLFGRTIALQQQWGIPFIAASLETVGVDAEVATRSRLRAA
jgi:drug/metabolite transporter superfamily protein YnfA